MSGHKGPGTAPGPAYQFRASLSVGQIPHAAADPAWRKLARRVIPSGTPREAVELPEPDASDPETTAALAAWDADRRMPLLIAPAGVRFAPVVPFLAEHNPGDVLAPELDIGIRGDKLSANGWTEHADRLRTFAGVSARYHVRRARLVHVTDRWAYCDVTEAEVIELSAVVEPLTAGTSLFVADAPGIRLWDPPGGERYSRREPPGARWRALSDEGEARYAAMMEEAAP